MRARALGAWRWRGVCVATSHVTSLSVLSSSVRISLLWLQLLLLYAPRLRTAPLLRTAPRLRCSGASIRLLVSTARKRRRLRARRRSRGPGEVVPRPGPVTRQKPPPRRKHGRADGEAEDRPDLRLRGSVSEELPAHSSTVTADRSGTRREAAGARCCFTPGFTALKRPRAFVPEPRGDVIRLGSSPPP